MIGLSSFTTLGSKTKQTKAKKQKVNQNKKIDASKLVDKCDKPGIKKKTVEEEDKKTTDAAKMVKSDQPEIKE